MQSKGKAWMFGTAGAGVALVAMIGAVVLMSTAPEANAASCARGTKPAVIGGNFKCLRVGQRCLTRYQGAYRRYSLHCANGRLRRGSTGPFDTAAPPQGPPPPPLPPPAPTPAAIDGHYKGVTSQNETFEFDISNGGLSFRGLKTGQINQGCTPQFHIYGNYFNWPDYSVSVSRSGDFTIDTERSGAYVGQSPATTHLTIRGHVTGSTASGSVELNTSFRDVGTGIAYSCGSGLQSWTVTRTG
jgi:hypothetical protein